MSTNNAVGPGPKPRRDSVPRYSGFRSTAESISERWEAPANERERHAAIHSPAARRRRAQLTKYVAGTVGAAFVLCAAAFAKSTIDRERSQADELGHLAPVRANGSALADRPGAQARLAEAPQGAPPAKTIATVAPDPSSPPTAAPQEPASPSATGSPQDARREREASRNALDRGHVAAAIEAGERSVAIDPADGEAWLILGAAYQQKGDSGSAHRCFRACVEQGKHGPIGECRAMGGSR